MRYSRTAVDRCRCFDDLRYVPPESRLQWKSTPGLSTSCTASFPATKTNNNTQLGSSYFAASGPNSFHLDVHLRTYRKGAAVVYLSRVHATVLPSHPRIFSCTNAWHFEELNGYTYTRRACWRRFTAVRTPTLLWHTQAVLSPIHTRTRWSTQGVLLPLTLMRTLVLSTSTRWSIQVVLCLIHICARWFCQISTRTLAPSGCPVARASGRPRG